MYPSLNEVIDIATTIGEPTSTTRSAQLTQSPTSLAGVIEAHPVLLPEYPILTASCDRKYPGRSLASTLPDLNHVFRPRLLDKAQQAGDGAQFVIVRRPSY